MHMVLKVGHLSSSYSRICRPIWNSLYSSAFNAQCPNVIYFTVCPKLIASFGIFPVNYVAQTWINVLFSV